VLIALTALEWSGRLRLGRVVDGLVSGPASTTVHWPVKVFAVVWAAGMLSILFQGLTHPALLWRRLRGGPLFEPDPSQRLIVSVLVPCVVALFAVSLLDAVRGWSQVLLVVVLLGDVLVAGGLVVLNLVFRVNAFAAAAVRVEPGQTVVSTGPYALVRHPMYSAGLLLFLGAPLALGSWWGLVLDPPILALIIVRLMNEEAFLSIHLPGYREYAAKVNHRLIPSIW
jgi:protein-S-isoprenylcysteine O-methyltransferase Ste14